MFELHAGDCIDVLKTLPANSVDSVVTSPPYAMQRAAAYGGIPEKDYPQWTVTWMGEVWRVLRDDGSVIINISPHIRKGQLSDYVLRTRLALREAGWVELGELIWNKPDAPPFGHNRRPRRSWESLLWFGKQPQPACYPYAAGTPNTSTAYTSLSKGSQSYEREGWTHYDFQHKPGPVRPLARTRDVVTLPSNREDVGHPAPFPWQLAEWCGKLITPPCGTLLDPFTGSSSAGVAAIRNGWHFIGIDQSPGYIEISDRRLRAALAGLTDNHTDRRDHTQ